MSEKRPFISIIIPHFNDSEHLASCLRQLENQTYPSERYEIIVVDNGSDMSPDLVIAQSPHSQLIIETKPGSYVARNKGIDVAKGDIIAFTDADCLPQPDWLEKGKDSLLQNDNIGLVAGRINVYAADRNAPTAPEIYEQLYAFNIENYVRSSNFGVTANLFVRRGTIDEVGKFDGSLKSGGDMEWGKRIHAAGYDISYGQDVVVDHPALNSAQALYRKKRRVHGGYHDMLVQRNAPFGYFLKGILRDAQPPFSRSVELLSKNEYALSTRLQLLKITWIANYSAVFERVRLLFGGRSKRM